MAGAIYSTRFLQLIGAGPGTLSYTCPAGFVLILRDVDLVTNVVQPSTVALVLLDGAYIDQWFNAPDATSSHQWRGRQVANAGEALTVEVHIAAIWGALSGYLLST